MAENNTSQEKELNEVLKVRREKLEMLRQNGKDPFVITQYDCSDYFGDIIQNFEDGQEMQVSIAGRLMSKRVMGKASFAHLRDNKGLIQLYVRRDDIGVEEYTDFKQMDIGDIVGVKGFVFRTQTGEVSVHVQKICLLAKSLQVLPEKYHGLKDIDARYRQRYVDLIINPEVKEAFQKRSLIIREIRNYLDTRGFLEVETPVLQTMAGCGYVSAHFLGTLFETVDCRRL